VTIGVLCGGLDIAMASFLMCYMHSSRSQGCNASCSRLASARSTRRAVRMVVRAEGETQAKSLNLSMAEQAVSMRFLQHSQTSARAYYATTHVHCVEKVNVALIVAQYFI
jgi:hypothetical protein